MSLLLDALKKAADEKKKNRLSTQARNTLEETNQNTDESMELELDPDANTNIDINSAVDEFPQMREPDTRATVTKTGPVISDKIKHTPEDRRIELPKQTDKKIDTEILELENPESEHLQSTAAEQTEVEQNKSETDELNALEIYPNTTTHKTTEHSTPNVKAVSPEQKNTKKRVTTPPLTTPSTKTTSDNTLQSTIKSEQALSQLINKSNRHTHKERLKLNILIAVLLVFVLGGSALYFYIELQTARQDIYITNTTIETPPPQPARQPVSDNKSIPAPPSRQPSPIISTSAQVEPFTPVVSPVPPPIQHSRTTPVIKFIQARKSDPVHTLLLQAYAAFHAQSYTQSEDLYNQVLKREEKNRDALLGLAAIAIKQQRYGYARQKYRYLLKLNPTDNIATAGLSSIDKQTDAQLSVSKLKFMLKNSPDSAPLYFVLGNIYSQQNNWPEAQAAYFSAWVADDKNADYAFNLAISLDHLEKSQQALKFYQLSLKLKPVSESNFSVTSAQNRIDILQKSPQ